MLLGDLLTWCYQYLEVSSRSGVNVYWRSRCQRGYTRAEASLHSGTAESVKADYETHMSSEEPVEEDFALWIGISLRLATPAGCSFA